MARPYCGPETPAGGGADGGTTIVMSPENGRVCSPTDIKPCNKMENSGRCWSVWPLQVQYRNTLDSWEGEGGREGALTAQCTTRG